MTPPNLSKEQFKDILSRYSKGQSPPHEEKFVEQWYASLGNDELRPAIDASRQKEIEDQLWSAITLRIDKARDQSSKEPDTTPYTNSYWRVAGIAAAVLISFSVAFFLVRKKEVAPAATLEASTHQPDTEIMADGSRPRSVALEDGTRITLQPHSKIRVKDFLGAVNREVYLEGEAFFEVAHDKEHPFLVYTGEITTKVLGTSFTISAKDLKNSIEVSVKTGRVSVTKTQKKSSSPLHILTEEIILTPNQKAIYDGNEVMAALVEKPKRIINEGKEQMLMRFDEEHVTTILNAIEEAYGVEMVFNEEQLSKCLLTTTLSNEDLYDRLSIICKAIHGSYKLNGTQIIIESKGCEEPTD